MNGKKESRLILRTDVIVEDLLLELLKETGKTKSDIVRMAIMNFAKEVLDEEVYQEIIMKSF